MQYIETVGDLIDALGSDRSRPIRVATQPGYPMEAHFSGVAHEGGDVWLAIGEHFGYEVPRGLHEAAEQGF